MNERKKRLTYWECEENTCFCALHIKTVISYQVHPSAVVSICVRGSVICIVYSAHCITIRCVYGVVFFVTTAFVFLYVGGRIGTRHCGECWMWTGSKHEEHNTHSSVRTDSFSSRDTYKLCSAHKTATHLLY